MSSFTEKLKKLGACKEAIEWASDYTSLQKSWDNCKRSDWMLWLIGRTCGKVGTPSRKKLVRTACKCARLAWKSMPDEGKKAIRTAEKYCEGKATLQEVKAASYAANAAAKAAYAAYSANTTAYASDAAADTTYAAANAAANAAYAAYAANTAAYAAEAERKKTLKKCADIVRTAYPNAPRI